MNTRLDVVTNVLNYSVRALGAIVKSAFVSEFPNRVQNGFNEITGDTGVL